MAAPIQVYGYHGTSVTAVEGIKANGFLPSTKSWDWLGDGAYFFQDAPTRAWEWARRRHPSAPAVVCASIWLDNCIDLLDIPWARAIADLYPRFRERLEAAGRAIPRQDPTTGNRRLDRIVLNFIADFLDRQGERVLAVRGAFQEGEPIFPDSALHDRSHIQIAVRDNSVIGGIWQIDQEGRRLE